MLSFTIATAKIMVKWRWRGEELRIGVRKKNLTPKIFLF